MHSLKPGNAREIFMAMSADFIETVSQVNLLDPFEVVGYHSLVWDDRAGGK